MGLFKIAISGAVWTTISSVIRSVVSLLQVSILTRFLEKADFGLVAIASLFIGFTSIFLDLGISIGILHKQDISKNEYSSLFWLNIITGIFLTAILMSIAPIVAISYSEPELTTIIQLLSLNMLFASLGNQHRTVQQKKMRFSIIAIIEVVSAILTISAALSLAFMGLGVYSLVFSTLIGTLTANLIFLVIGLRKDSNICLHFSMKETVPYLKIGSFYIGSHLLDYLSREIDIIIISATLGKETLGLYSLCKKLITALYSTITPIFNKVLTPLLASMQNDIVKIKKIFYDIIESASIVLYPIFIAVAIVPSFIISLAFGYTYLDGAVILSLLALNFGYSSPNSPASCLQVAYGRTDLGFYWTICRIFINSIAALIGAQFTIEILVSSILIANIVTTPFFWYVTIRPIIGGSFVEYFLKSFKPFIISILVGISFYFFINKIVMVSAVIIALLSFVIIYILIICLLFRNSYLISKIKSNNYIKLFCSYDKN